MQAPAAPPLLALEGPNGIVVANLAAIEKLIREIWPPLWCKHQGDEHWERSFDAVDRLLPEGVVHLLPLTREDLAATIVRTRNRSSCAADAWAVGELKPMQPVDAP